MNEQDQGTSRGAARIAPEQLDGWRSVTSLRLEQLNASVDDIRASIREMAAAINRIALIEERQLRANDALARQEARTEAIQKRVEALEVAAPASSATGRWVERGIVALIGFLAAVAFGKFGGGGG